MATPSFGDLPVSPFVSKLLAAKKSGPAFATRGYIGAADDKVVRLYFDLSLDSYVEIPRSAVLHADVVPGSAHQRAELIVDGAQELKMVSVHERLLKPADMQDVFDRSKAKKTAPDPCATPATTGDCTCPPSASTGIKAPGGPNTLDMLKDAALVREQQKRAQEEDHESEPDLLRVAGCVFMPWTCRR
jgi:hypothetical protein